MRPTPIPIRTFLVGTVLVLLLVPPLVGGAAYLIERQRQQAAIQQRLDTALAYLTSHGAAMQGQAAEEGFGRLLNRLDLLAEVTLLAKPPLPGKSQLYLSPALGAGVGKGRAAKATESGVRQSKRGAVKTRIQSRSVDLEVQGSRGTGGPAGIAPATGPGGTPTPAGWTADRARQIAVGTPKSRAFLLANLYYRPASRVTRALVALVSAVVVLLAGLAVAVWLAGRWMVAPLARLSAQVDKVAGGDLTISVPRSRISEVTNIAQAVEGMTASLGESAQRRAEADEARRFLVSSVAHDLRTPLFALRGHLQAIGSGLGDPTVHLARAEARADALERLIGNLFAYTRDDYAQPALRLEAVPVAELLEEVGAGLEHAARLRDITLELDGDPTIDVTVDRDRLKRSLTNILDNAIRHSPAGTPVYLGWAAADDSSVEITVRDRGPGIDPDLLPHIFEPGIRGTSPAGDPDGGAGLGLTIAKRLLEQQRATLTVHNRPEGGAEVRLTIPRAPSRHRSRRVAALGQRDSGRRPVGRDDLADQVLAGDGAPDA